VTGLAAVFRHWEITLYYYFYVKESLSKLLTEGSGLLARSP
jgi:hypothetical protein